MRRVACGAKETAWPCTAALTKFHKTFQPRAGVWWLIRNLPVRRAGTAWPCPAALNNVDKTLQSSADSEWLIRYSHEHFISRWGYLRQLCQISYPCVARLTAQKQLGLVQGGHHGRQTRRAQLVRLTQRLLGGEAVACRGDCTQDVRVSLRVDTYRNHPDTTPASPAALSPRSAPPRG